MSKKLKIIHWNCFSFGNKELEFKQFLLDQKPDIVLLNEVKLDQEKVKIKFFVLMDIYR